MSLPVSIGISREDQTVERNLIPAPSPIPSTDDRIMGFLTKSEPPSGSSVSAARLP